MTEPSAFPEQEWLEELRKLSALTPARPLFLRVRSRIVNVTATVFRLQVDGRRIRTRLEPSDFADSPSSDLWFDLPADRWGRFGIKARAPDHAEFYFFYSVVTPWDRMMPMLVEVRISTHPESADEINSSPLVQ